MIEIEPPADAVFEAISNPDELTNWFPDVAILEPRIGGSFQFIFYKDSDRRDKRSDSDAYPADRVLEFIPNRKLVYSWQHKNIPNSPETVVTWELEQIDKTKIRVTLIHSGFTGREKDKGIEQHNAGWNYFIQRLATYCSGRTGVQKEAGKSELSTLDKPNSFTIEQSYYLKVPPKKVFQAITDPKILVKWFLSKAKVVAEQGGTFSFIWIGGYNMTGIVKKFHENKAVSCSWHDKMPSGEMVESAASFQIAKKGRGTLIKLKHSGFTEPEHFAECSSR